MPESQLLYARVEAQIILGLQEQQLNEFFFEKSMSRNLARTVRQLDYLVLSGGDDQKLGEHALKRLGFDPLG